MYKYPIYFRASREDVFTFCCGIISLFGLRFVFLMSMLWKAIASQIMDHGLYVILSFFFFLLILVLVGVLGTIGLVGIIYGVISGMNICTAKSVLGIFFSIVSMLLIFFLFSRYPFFSFLISFLFG